MGAQNILKISKVGGAAIFEKAVGVQAREKVKNHCSKQTLFPCSLYFAPYTKIAWLLRNSQIVVTAT